ncbi:MAG: glycosyltransferase family 4 protein [Desulfobacca sp.]|uniref:glycosyltransferase family 4 protein n=1 Tax=Desulfobacca sp. TaxID=2067990 RepID=UPI00404B9E13
MESPLESSRPQVIVAQLGARMHYAVPVIFHRAGMLAHFFTDAYVGQGSAWHILTKIGPLIPRPWQPAACQRLLQRREDNLPADKVTAFNLLGYCYARDLQKTRDAEKRFGIHKKYSERFYRAVLHHKSFQGQAVWAFKGAAGPLFQAVKARGLKCIYEQFIAPGKIMHQLLRDEHALWPEWEGRYQGDAVEAMSVEIEEQGLSLADLVICASEFVRQGLISQKVAQDLIRVVPYGIEVSQYTAKTQPWDGQRPLRLLFVGGVTVRKGVQYLYEALRLLNHPKVEARVVGPVALSAAAQEKFREVAQLTGQVPRHEVRQHYQWADLFVFPSICEGSATVTYEALASGLPVLTTPNAGSVVRDGVDGFLVPIRDSAALAEKIDLLASNPDLLASMSRNARERGQEFSWERYGERLLGAIKSVMMI